MNIQQQEEMDKSPVNPVLPADELPLWSQFVDGLIPHSAMEVR